MLKHWRNRHRSDTSRVPRCGNACYSINTYINTLATLKSVLLQRSVFTTSLQLHRNRAFALPQPDAKMPPQSPLVPPRNHQLASNRVEAKWLACTQIRFFQLSKTAFKSLPVSHAFCFAGIDPKMHYEVTYGNREELDKALVCVRWYRFLFSSSHIL